MDDSLTSALDGTRLVYTYPEMGTVRVAFGVGAVARQEARPHQLRGNQEAQGDQHADSNKGDKAAHYAAEDLQNFHAAKYCTDILTLVLLEPLMFIHLTRG